MLRLAHSKTMRRTKRNCEVCKLWWIACICVQRMLLLPKRFRLKEKTRYQVLSSGKKTVILQTNSTVSAINIIVLVAEVLSKIRSTFNTMSYSDIINVVSVRASRVFGDKLEGQKLHDRIKNDNKNFTNVPRQQISTNSHQFSPHG